MLCLLYAVYRLFLFSVKPKKKVWPRMVNFAQKTIVKSIFTGHLMMIRPAFPGDIHQLLLKLRERLIEKALKSMQRRVSAPIFIDVGSYIGRYTLIGARVGWRVISIEPHPKNYKLLVKNIKLNGYGKLVKPVNVALSDINGEGELFLGSDPVGSSIVYSDERSVKVILKTLDSLLSEFGIEKVDLIKIDVEGAEMRVLNGGEKTLHKVEKCIVEAHSNTLLHEVSRFLVKHGFKTTIVGLLVYAFKKNAC